MQRFQSQNEESQLIGKKRKWPNASEGFKKIDAFGSPLPTFNFKGKEKVNTIVGGFVTLILFLTVLTYALLKFTDLVSKPNPVINTYFQED